MYGRMDSSVSGPMPWTFRSSSTDANGPCSSRYMIIKRAFVRSTLGILVSSASVAVLILTRIRSGSEDTAGGAEDDGTADDGGAWLLGAALDGLPWDTGGVEIGAWWEALPWEDASGVSGSDALDSGKSELSRAEDSGKLGASGRDTAGGSDGRLAVDASTEAFPPEP